MTLQKVPYGAGQDLSLADFKDIYNRYWKLLYTTALSKTGDHADSVDIVQELFIYLWEHRAELTIRESVEGYLLTSLRNRILNHFRQQGVREKVRLDYARFVETIVGNSDLIEDSALRSVAEEAVQKAVEQLPEKMKYILVQHRYHQKTIQQLATELQIAPQTVKNQLTKALHRIEYLLKERHAQEIGLVMLVLVNSQ